MQTTTVRIAERFQGPPRSGNGGYACGLAARGLPGAVQVRLKAPPPLDTDLRLETGIDAARLLHGEALLAEARCATLALDVPACPSHEAAVDALSRFVGRERHLFPRCFVCGPARAPGDGLCIFPGPLAGSAARVLAAPWRPDASTAAADGSVDPLFVWSALDCPGGFAHWPLPPGTATVLGELCVSIEAPVQPGEPCVVLGWPIDAQRRKRIAGSALYGPQGRLVAKARATWIEIALDAWQ